MWKTADRRRWVGGKTIPLSLPSCPPSASPAALPLVFLLLVFLSWPHLPPPLLTALSFLPACSLLPPFHPISPLLNIYPFSLSSFSSYIICFSSPLSSRFVLLFIFVSHLSCYLRSAFFSFPSYSLIFALSPSNPFPYPACRPSLPISLPPETTLFSSPSQAVDTSDLCGDPAIVPPPPPLPSPLHTLHITLATHGTRMQSFVRLDARNKPMWEGYFKRSEGFEREAKKEGRSLGLKKERKRMGRGCCYPRVARMKGGKFVWEVMER